jgi:pSer/pThr/pTyr-binding forkhead associated (FHA) protein
MTTISQRPDMNLFQAKLVLKEKNEFLIQEFDRIFGREDFVGLVSSEDLMFIGKEHFKITKKNDGFYIEDLNTKNGTSINGMDINGKVQKKLKNEDQILVAKTIKIRYVE